MNKIKNEIIDFVNTTTDNDILVELSKILGFKKVLDLPVININFLAPAKRVDKDVLIIPELKDDVNLESLKVPGIWTVPLFKRKKMEQFSKSMLVSNKVFEDTEPLERKDNKYLKMNPNLVVEVVLKKGGVINSKKRIRISMSDFGIKAVHHWWTDKNYCFVEFENLKAMKQFLSVESSAWYKLFPLDENKHCSTFESLKEYQYNKNLNKKKELAKFLNFILKGEYI